MLYPIPADKLESMNTDKHRIAFVLAATLVGVFLAGSADKRAADMASLEAFDASLPKYSVMADRWVKIKRSKYGHYITHAQINDAKVIALIDTGASVIALSYEDAESAGLHPFRLKFDQPMRTANGIAKAARVRLGRVIVDKIIMRDVEGVVMPKGAMRGTLLGMSFLNRLTAFSFDRGVLHLEE